MLTLADLQAMEERLNKALPEGAMGPMGEVVADHVRLVSEVRDNLLRSHK